MDLVEINREVVSNYEKTIDGLAVAFRLAEKVVVVQSELPAKQVIVDYHNEVVALRKEELNDVTMFAARWHEQACRITLILHAVKHGSEAGTQEIQEDTAKAGVAIAKWFASEQLAILNSYRDQHQVEQLKNIWLFAETHPQGFTARELARSQFSGNSEMANSVLAPFVAKGLLQQETVQTGGKPKTCFKAPARGVSDLI